MGRPGEGEARADRRGGRRRFAGTRTTTCATGSTTWRSRSGRWKQPTDGHTRRPRAACATSCPKTSGAASTSSASIAEVYQRYGFEPLETPAVENIETLLGKYGEEGDRLIFKILKRGEGAETGQADLALRYDLTVPLARVVAEYRGARCRSSSSATRCSRCGAPTGRRRGASASSTSATWTPSARRSMVVEAELLAAGADVLARLGFTDFTIRLNHRQAAGRRCSTPAACPPRCTTTALVALDKLDKIGREGVATELDGARRSSGGGARRWSSALFARRRPSGRERQRRHPGAAGPARRRLAGTARAASTS